MTVCASNKLMSIVGKNIVMMIIIVLLLTVVGGVFPRTIEILVHTNDLLEDDPVIANDGPTPIVMWHGMGDTCCNPLSLGAIKQILKGKMPEVYITSLEIGNNQVEDYSNSFFMNVNHQVDLACFKIGNDTKLKNGYNALGFSQGGQFLRAVAERCPQGMKKLITFGGQHQGVYGLPRCPGEDSTICDDLRKILNYGAYTNLVQNHLVQAQYWHDPLAEEEYKEKSIFLADINNEHSHKNKRYKENLTKLEKLVLIKFSEDSVVDPVDTEWFGFYAPGQSTTMLPYNETSLYKEDWIGLRQLDEDEKLDFLIAPGDHMHVTQELLEEITHVYLK